MGFLDIRSVAVSLVLDLCRVRAERSKEGSPEIVCRHNATTREPSQLDIEPLLLPDVWRFRGDGSLSADFSNRDFQADPEAGLRTAGFVVLATATRPLGGFLADKVGGRAILKWVFPATALFSIFLACPMMLTFTIGALGVAAFIGLGNGAVFKLVPEYFPQSVGSVTGIVGAAGGLGGFFPPLILGLIKQQTGSFTMGFILLGVFSLICLAVLLRPTSKTVPVPVSVS
jgi:nitrate/nitrite transporter NarK